MTTQYCFTSSVNISYFFYTTIDIKKNYSIPHSDSSPLMMNYTLKRWQDSLVQYIHNKLHEMQFLVCKTLCSYSKYRKV